jgi:hypothetical protein
VLDCQHSACVLGLLKPGPNDMKNSRVAMHFVILGLKALNHFTLKFHYIINLSMGRFLFYNHVQN